MTKKTKQRHYLKPKVDPRSLGLGRVVAEEDPNLVEYYVSPDRYVAKALNVNDSTVFFVGPKGVGKSAVLQMVRLTQVADQNRIINISPDDLAFSALANISATTPILSDVGQYSWLFKSLWDYILALEILRREYSTGNQLWDVFKALFRGRHETEARRLLKISIDDTGKPQPTSLTDRILQLVNEVELSGDVRAVKIAGKTTLRNPTAGPGKELGLLNLVNSVARQIANELKHPYYILIDDLDRHWTGTEAQNAFIAALFMSLRAFSKPPNVKCVVSLREQIYRQIPLVDRDKFHDWVCHVRWDPTSLRQMLEARIRFKFGWPPQDVWGGMFPANSFDHLRLHTNERPREVMRLTSICIEEAQNQSHNRVEEQDLIVGIKRF
jgi:hypothetical protein